MFQLRIMKIYALMAITCPNTTIETLALDQGMKYVQR